MAACFGVFIAVTPVKALDYSLGFSTLLGGSADEELREVLVLDDGTILVGGQSHSNDYPVSSSAVQQVYAGEPAGSGNPGVVGGDMVLTRLSASGDSIVASTYFGGSKQERSAYAMALDQDGNVVFATVTRSNDLPTTNGAYQRQYGGGATDMMVAKISDDLSTLIWSTYVGRSGEDTNRAGFALDADDNVVLAGRTDSTGLVTPGAYNAQGGGWDVSVAKLSADGSSLIFASKFGGSRDEAVPSVRVGTDGDIQLFGHTWSDDLPTVTPFQGTNPGGVGSPDGFVATLSGDGASLLGSSYLGGSGAEFGEHFQDFAPDGSRWVVGYTNSSDYPVTGDAFQSQNNGSGDAFVTKLSADGNSILYSTYFGGSGADSFLSPVVDSQGRLLITGGTTSTDLPVTPNALQSELAGGADGYVAVLSADGQKVLYATYLGGSLDDKIRQVEVAPNGDLLLVGRTASGDFPISQGALQDSVAGGRDGFIVRLAMTGLEGDYNSDGVVDAADYTVWRDSLGSPAGSLPNDSDGGAIGAAQYATWVSRYGAVGIPAATSNTVPEPGSACLSLVLLLLSRTSRAWSYLDRRDPITG
ncbi:MAG: hypothetical protein AAFV43_13465 [Planctomycetota bacterium]